MGKDDRLFVGVDLGGTNIQAGVVDADGTILGRSKTKTRPENGAEAVVGRIAKTIDEAIVEAKRTRADIAGVGIGAPGVIDFDHSVVVTAVNLRWNNFPLAKVLKAQIDLPVLLDNDVNVCTWGECCAGAAKKFHDVLGIFVGTGIGGGLVFGDKLYRGHFGSAGEIGHTILHADAGLGRRTLENRASRTAIVNLLVELIRANHASMIDKLVDGKLEDVRSKVLAKAVESKDELACEVVARAAHEVGVAAANAVTLLSLPCVVIGGGLTEALGSAYVDLVRIAFRKYVFPSELRACEIVQSKLGDDAGLVGAAFLARQPS
ncbi:MAG: ROK family protein [Phycisphaeraceae bacterium]|nr:ROK family protein [Phycisphaeraceae bacterium]